MKYLKQVMNKLGAYKYVLIVVAVGLIMLLWPNAPPENNKASTITLQETPDTLEKQLEEVLSKTDGVGRVSVLLTRKSDIETQYVYDTASRERKQWDGGLLISAETDTDTKVVTGNGADGEQPLIRSRTYPVYQGALIVCDGALNSEARAKVLEAVAALTNLGYDKITVAKMKQ